MAIKLKALIFIIIVQIIKIKPPSSKGYCRYRSQNRRFSFIQEFKQPIWIPRLAKQVVVFPRPIGMN